MSLSEEHVHKRKEEIRKIHHIIDVYYKRGWVEQEKYEKYLRILDKIKVNDDEYHDKMLKFRKKVEHIKKTNTQHRSSKSIHVFDMKGKETSNRKVKFEVMEEHKSRDANKVDTVHENAQIKVGEMNPNSKISIRMDDSETIEVALDTSKTTNMRQNPTETKKENEQKKVLDDDKNDRESTKHSVPKGSIPLKQASNHPTEPFRHIQKKNISTPISDCKLDRNDTERVFVEMCVFARLGFLQPQSCLRCVYNSVLQDKVSETIKDQVPCDRVIAWRKDANKKIDPENMKEILTFVKCRDAKEWASGRTAENMRWDQATKKLLTVQ